MTEAQPPFQSPDFTSPNMNTTSTHSKRRKIIGQCPTCDQSFASRSELRSHMADSYHPSADESDAISFGEMSDYDSFEDESVDHHAKPTPSQYEPNLERDGFEFSSSADQDGFDAFEGSSAGMFPNPNIEQGSVHTIPEDNEQNTTNPASFQSQRSSQAPMKEALGVLYCAKCDKYFGNEKWFKRHFIFGVRHGEEERGMRELYHKVWARTWEDEARDMAVVVEDEMEM